MNRSSLPPVQQAMFDLGADDARAGRPASPPDGEPLAKAYQAGYNSIAPAAKSPAASSSSKQTGRAKSSSSKRTSSKRKSSRRTGGRSKARSAGRRTTSRAERQLLAPIERQTGSALATLGLIAAVAVLYNLIVNAGTTATVIDRLVDAIGWLDRPTPIPYRTN